MACGKWMSFELLVLAAVCGCQANGPQKPFRLDSLAQPAAGRVSQSPRPTPAKAGVAASARQSTARQAAAKPAVANKVAVNAPVGAASATTRGPAAPGSVARASHTFQQAGNKVQRAFLPEPRKVAQTDATSLTQDPGPLQPGLYLAAARMLEQRGDLQGALAKYEQLLQSEPTNLAGMIGQARIFHRRDEMDKAIEAYQRAMNTHGQDPVILNDLALCYARSGRKEDAITSLRAAVVSSPDSLLYRNNLAALLVETDRESEAVRVLEETHGPAIAHYNVGYLLFQRGLADKARLHFVTALQSDPNLRAAQVMLEKTAEVSPPGGPQVAAAPPNVGAPALPQAVSQAAPQAVVPAVAATHSSAALTGMPPEPPSLSGSGVFAASPASKAPVAAALVQSTSSPTTPVYAAPSLPLAVVPASLNGGVHDTVNEVAHAVLEQPSSSQGRASLAVGSQDATDPATVAFAVGETTSGDSLAVQPTSSGADGAVTPVDASQLMIRQPERVRAKPKSSLVAPLPR